MGILDFLRKTGESQDPLFKDLPVEESPFADQGDAGADGGLHPGVVEPELETYEPLPSSTEPLPPDDNPSPNI